MPFIKEAPFCRTFLGLWVGDWCFPNAAMANRVLMTLQAVTVATLMTGHITICKAVAYIFAQFLGAILGVLLQVNCSHMVFWPPSDRD